MNNLIYMEIFFFWWCLVWAFIIGGGMVSIVFWRLDQGIKKRGGKDGK